MEYGVLGTEYMQGAGWGEIDALVREQPSPPAPLPKGEGR